MRKLWAASNFTISCCFLLTSLAISRGASIVSSLKLGSSLSINQTLLSANATFEFGFFSIPTGSSAIYLGIWYASMAPFTSVWVANREKAVSQNATCVFDVNGQVILYNRGEKVWSIEENGSLLVLSDSGNLIMKSETADVIWQSFDHPGNTWLPTMLLGPGKKLQSWHSPDNPSPGHYTLMMGRTTNFICVYNDTSTYYDSGYWNGNKFSNVPEMQNNYIYGFSFNSSGFRWEPSGLEAFRISRFVIEYSGFITQSSYQESSQSWSVFWVKPSNPCDVERMCGPNSICHNTEQPNCKCIATAFKPVNDQEWNQNIFRQGCERKSLLNCSTNNVTNDGFISMNQTKFAWSFTTSLAMADLQKCKKSCLADCSCNGAFFNADGFGNCSLFSEDLYDGTISSSAVGTFYTRVSAIDLPSSMLSRTEKGKSHIVLITLLVGGIAILAMTSLAVYLLFRRRGLTPAGQPEAGMRTFSYAELQAATKNFKEKLGSGGFGTVYRGSTGDLEFAVKRLESVDEGEKQFRAEVRTIGTIQHVNLVRLLGFCYEGKHRLLVYEMAINGSLASHLFATDDARATTLTWSMRRSIALGAAHGIAYLHDSCRQRIIHCDIKPENILLDASFNVKVADFGLAKLMGRDFSRVLTTMRGTRGYLAPEWIAALPITSKADVYSFGMTLLELISGQRNVPKDSYFASSTPNSMFFPIRVALHINHPCDEDLARFLDARVRGDVNMEELKKMLHCAIWCIQDNEDLRPSMNEVVKILEGNILKGPPPIPKLLQCLVESDCFSTSKESTF